MAKARYSKYQKAVIGLALLVFVGTNLITLFFFHRSPHIHDEAAYDFQAKIFLLGRLYVPSPCAKEFFDFPHVINNGRWYSQYPPGFPALLALGYIFNAPWIINPLFASLFIILVFFLGKEIFDEKTGLLAALLTSISYWFLILSSSLMSHTTHLFFCSLSLLFFVKSIKRTNIKNGFIAGFGFLMAFLIRPYESVLFIAAPGIYLVILFIKEPRKYLKAILPIVIMAIASTAILMAYNYGTTGHPLKMGYIEKYGPDHGIGFGRKGYTDVPHTFLKGSNNVWGNIIELHLHLYGWPISSLLGVIICFFSVIKIHINKDEKKFVILLFLIILTTLIGLTFYWGSFPLLGARMCFQLIGVLSLLSAIGIVKLFYFMLGLISNKTLIFTGLVFIFAIFILYAAFVRLPDYKKYSFEFLIPDLIYPDFLSFNKKIDKTIEELNIKNAVILMKPLYLPKKYFPDNGWTAGFIKNDPILKNDIIFAHYKPEDIFNLFVCSPRKSFYLIVYTVKKAMIFKLNFFEQTFTTIPYSFNKDKRYEIELVDKPSSFFKSYSSEFSDFLKTLDTITPIDLDFQFLINKASLKEKEGNYGRAAQYYEAVLQLEPYLENRIRIYKRLAVCYFKTKRIDLAKRITEKLYGATKLEVDKIIPEKGI